MLTTKIRVVAYLTMLLALLLGHAPPAESRNMSRKDRNTLIGVGVGAIGGAILSKGDMWGTIAGAAAGGVIGNVTTKDRHRDRRDRDRDYRRDRRDWRR